MKYAQSTVHGNFRSDLAFWHMGRKFDGLPILNEDFISCVGINPEDDPSGP